MTRPRRVAVASRSFSRHPVLRAELLALYPQTTFNDAGASLSGDALASFLRGHDGVITALERVDASLLDQLPELEVLSKYGVGYDMIDLAELHRRGIRFGWTGGVNRRSVSELAISMMIALLRRLPEAGHEIRTGQWRQLQGRQLTGRTVGIVGCGHVGKDLAELLRGFACRVLAHDILDFSEFYTRTGVIPVSLEALLAEAEIISLHLPLSDATRAILSRQRFSQMRPGAILINTARGELIDEDALLGALKAGTISGAGLDVLATEPPVDRVLLEMPNVLVTPHIGGSSEEAVLAMGRAAIAGLSEAKLRDRL